VRLQCAWRRRSAVLALQHLRMDRRKQTADAQTATCVQLGRRSRISPPTPIQNLVPGRLQARWRAKAVRRSRIGPEPHDEPPQGEAGRASAVATAQVKHRKELRQQASMRRRQPIFRSMPAPLLEGNPEGSAATLYMTSLACASAAVIGGRIGGYSGIHDAYLWLACASLVMCGVLFVRQAIRVVHFWRTGVDACWASIERPTSGAVSEVEDPLMALFGWTCCRHRLRQREHGAFTLTDADAGEPQRTERALTDLVCTRLLGVCHRSYRTVADVWASRSKSEVRVELTKAVGELIGVNLADRSCGRSRIVVVASVTPSSLAASACLMPGDTLISINGRVTKQATAAADEIGRTSELRLELRRSPPRENPCCKLPSAWRRAGQTSKAVAKTGTRVSGQLVGYVSGLEQLEAWLGSGTGSHAGVAHESVLLAAQLMLALSTGVMFAHPFGITSTGMTIHLTVVVALTTGCTLFTACTTNDLLEGLTNAVVFALEAAAAACLLSSTLMQLAIEEDPWDSERVARVAQAMELAVIAANLLVYSAFVPLWLVAYDSCVVPVAQKVRQASPGSPAEVVCAVLLAAVEAPVEAAAELSGSLASFCGMNAGVTDFMLGELRGTASELVEARNADMENVEHE